MNTTTMMIYVLFAILLIALIVVLYYYSTRESFYQKPRPTLEQDYDRKISRDFSPLIN
jgi:cell division protein FtsL